MRFDTLLIANRGEIALRIIRTARAMGLNTIAVYTDADHAAPHVAAADRAMRIGAGPAGDSYLSAERLLAAAQDSGAQAIHPGYGFLSENAEFAEAVAQAGLILIGPSPEAMRVMGDKAAARAAMIASGVPCLPGYEGADQSDDALVQAAERIGYPVMVKAAAGGGGRGMRLVDAPEALVSALTLARSEAEGAFGSGALILERALTSARHVEFQIIADTQGTVLHLGERDCSVQRRHQKIIEEAPCPVLSDDQRARMGAAAVAAAKSVHYTGAGTVEFLLGEDGAFYFLEMNTRLQVEHPVTECVTGLDLVELQIAVAQGAPLPLTQADVQITGHAIEARLYAEDPANGFLPATGPVHLWHPAEAEGLRIDAGITQGQQISAFYDPMLAKIIAHGPDRDTALRRLRRAVAESVLLGCDTNAAFLAEVLAQPAFMAGQATTDLLAQAYPDGFSAPLPRAQEAAIAAALLMQDRRDRMAVRAGGMDADLFGWSGAPLAPRLLRLRCAGQVLEMKVRAKGAGWQITQEDVTTQLHLSRRGAQVSVDMDGERRSVLAHLDESRVYLATQSGQLVFDEVTPSARAMDETGGQVVAPMPGVVLSIDCAQGDHVAAGDTLAVMEAMKMQHRIAAPISGRIARVLVSVGQQLDAGMELVEIEADGGQAG
ncbi:biotin carboxylase N-terminal domain-containing protein [Ruegeria sp. 2205SS24-7]|uniref:ATP-binding protein n=1 Tax=Ruegeria discodermiae TaxID=3064389 RepID=UPI0027427573|nr:biotin carboxylase N-terminal domain-containing protein [Ruegeria sp. 2205SS24-7]MDP5219338.1 biotin carboxylase N-terminal domain-containing protein [Ruegeria sp. 2205SS24-7]